MLVTLVNDLATHTTAADASFDVAARSDIVPADVVATNIVDCDVRDGCRSASVTSADADCSQTDDVITTQLVDNVIDDKTADCPQVTSLGFSKVTSQLTDVTAVEKLANSDAKLLLRAVEQSENVVDVVNSPRSTTTTNVTSAEVKEQVVDNATLEELVFDNSLSKRDIENDVGETESGRASLSTAAQGEDEKEMERDGDGGEKGGDSPLADGAEEAMDIDDDDAYYSGSTVSSSFDHQSTTSSSADEPKNNTGDHAR